jgi:hypothetical protein
MKTLKEFRKEWEEITLMKLFEIPVKNKRTNEADYIIFDISIIGWSFVAQHEALTTKQENNKKIAFVSVSIDKDFSIDEHLQALYSECINAIIDSEFFELTEES